MYKHAKGRILMKSNVKIHQRAVFGKKKLIASLENSSRSSSKRMPNEIVSLLIGVMRLQRHANSLVFALQGMAQNVYTRKQSGTAQENQTVPSKKQRFSRQGGP